MPGWSEGEQGMVHELQAKLKIKPTGMPTKIAPLKECVQSVSANDSGEVSWVVPTGLITFPSNIPGVSYHHWSAGVSLATTIAHKGALAGAKTMAASATRSLLGTEAGCAGEGNFQRRNRRHRISAAVAARSETAAGVEPQPHGALPADDARALFEKKAGVRLRVSAKVTLESPITFRLPPQSSRLSSGFQLFRARRASAPGLLRLGPPAPGGKSVAPCARLH